MTLHQNRLQQSSGNNQKRAERLFFYSFINNILGIDKLEPSVVTRYSIEVAKAFNKFYNNHTVLNVEDEGLKAARLELIKATAQVIKNALFLIGIDVVEKM